MVVTLPAKIALSVLGAGVITTGGVFTYQHFFDGGQKSSEVSTNAGQNDSEGSEQKSPVQNQGQSANSSVGTEAAAGRSGEASATGSITSSAEISQAVSGDSDTQATAGVVGAGA